MQLQTRKIKEKNTREEDTKQAIMRGLCAFNMEAIQLFRHDVSKSDQIRELVPSIRSSTKSFDSIESCSGASRDKPPNREMGPQERHIIPRRVSSDVERHEIIIAQDKPVSLNLKGPIHVSNINPRRRL
jgi:NAD(P)-dependent dehydrogenase (short-subunit alcohol dehydrogenase family)